ncbi:hypothetical protein [Cellulomonas sp. Y8]|uniref:hypothetical protein n=1 Tax=Cellulomonas sp. Y8 TaxID=2591145 RepID=UPI00143D41EA|nr:hypothetical protein [Cellulomonas sp. Y8]
MPPYRLLTRALAGVVTDRVPPGLVQVAVLLSVLTPVVGSLSGTGVAVPAATAESLPYYLTGTAQAAVLACLVLVWLVPSTALVLTAAGTAVCGLAPDALAGPSGLWLAAAAPLGVLAVADQLLAVRRRALARAVLRDGSSTVTLPPVHPAVRADLLRTGWGRGALGVLLLAAGLAATVLLVHDHVAATRFRAGAETAAGVVDRVTEDGLSMSVRVDEGAFDAPVNYQERSPGDAVRLRFDPVTGRAEAVDDVFDASTALIPVVGCGLTGGLLLVQVRRRRARLAALLDEPQPAVVALAHGAPRAGGALLTPVDDVTHLLATAPALVPVAGPALVLVVPDDDPDDDPDDGRDDFDDVTDNPQGHKAWDVAADAWHREDEDDDEHRVLVSELSDAELLDLAREVGADDEPPGEHDPFRPPAGDPVRAAGVPVVLMGLAGDDAPVAVGVGPDVYVSLRPLRPPRWRWPRRVAVAERPGAWRAFADSRDRAVEQLGRRAGRWLPWVALLPAGWGLRGMARWGDATWWTAAGLVLGLVALAWSVSVWGQPRVDLSPRGLRVRGFLLDTLVPWRRVTGTAADDEALVVRYDDDEPGGNAMLVPLGGGGLPLTRDGATPAEIRARIEGRAAAARAEPLRTPHGAVPPVERRPTVPVLAALAWLVVCVVAVAGA